MRRFIILVALILIVFLLRGGLVPLAIGISIAYLLSPLVDYLSKRLKTLRILVILFSYLTVLIILIAVALSFTVIITGKLQDPNFKTTISELAGYYYQYRALIEKLLGFSLIKLNTVGFLTNISSGVIKFFIGLVASIYLLKDKEYFIHLIDITLLLLLSTRAHRIFFDICRQINKVVRSFLKGVFIDSVIVALLSSAVLYFIKVDMAAIIGIFAGITNLIPYFGPFMGIIPAFIFAMINGGLQKALMAAIALTLVQQIECNFIYPKIIGDSTGLHPLFVLTAVTIAGYFGGLGWMILAVPIAGVIKILVITLVTEN